MWQDMKQQSRHSSESVTFYGERGRGQSDISLKSCGVRLLSKNTKYVCNVQQNSVVANICYVSIAIPVFACNNLRTSEQDLIVFQIDAFY
jgi:hypothetical protein